MSTTQKNKQLSSDLSLVLNQLVSEGMVIYAYHWDPPELELYLGDENPCHMQVTRETWEKIPSPLEFKEWIKSHMKKPTK